MTGPAMHAHYILDTFLSEDAFAQFAVYADAKCEV